MKTKSQVIKDNSKFKLLINAVITQLGGTDYVQDVNNHGMSAGFPGFTYYSDTHQFAISNRGQIATLLWEQADQLGHADVIEMVSHFGVFKGKGQEMDFEDKRELSKYLNGEKCEQSTITNLMAWFAAEEVCRMFEN